ncbi:RecX family transcriptional regulator [Tenacibaculum sp. AHE15PA]|uniref:regulatory protein RecX n=1 Tax=unclassified Tenacibaculum TaxID=2635139 RepID=UPI001C4F1FA5|nr:MULTISPECIES: regulatory protein RecX [unclassified Tenacibaculum]QXP72838.1 RecX family transcriptional regulator [Tenacibaculum sp. AHE14PA]QXP76752.1 RecX family transcriptional regulator [Tenacibaculum sp. AHE15PA]
MDKKVFTVDEVKRKMEHYCAYQDRCHKEVENKLREYSIIPEAIEMILLSLLKDNFLNEERFSKSYARGKFRIKKWGKQRIVRELKYRNISAYNIKTALKEINEQEYITTLYSLLDKKNDLVTEANEFKRKKKIADYLLYRGFESNLVYEALKTI